MDKSRKNTRGGGRNTRRREEQEFDQKVLDISRVARMVAGGRRFNFRATVILGDKKGRVGVGVGKGKDVAISIGKAISNAKKNIVSVPITPEGTIPYDIKGKQTGSVVYLKPGRPGRGIIAGGAVRNVCDLAGYKDITAKILSRSTNKLNNALATIDALNKIQYVPEQPKPQKKEVEKKTKKPSKAKNTEDKKKKAEKKTKTAK